MVSLSHYCKPLRIEANGAVVDTVSRRSLAGHAYYLQEVPENVRLTTSKFQTVKVDMEIKCLHKESKKSKANFLHQPSWQHFIEGQKSRGWIVAF